MLVGSESPTVTLHRPPPRESRVNSRLRPAPATSPEESRVNSRLGPAPAASPEESRVNSRLGPVSKLTRAPPLQRQGRVAASAATRRVWSHSFGTILRLAKSPSEPFPTHNPTRPLAR